LKKDRIFFGKNKKIKKLIFYIFFDRLVSMKNKIKLFLLTLTSILYLFGCGEPPKEANEISLLSWIEHLIPKLNSVRDNKVAKKQLSKELENSIDIISFYKDHTIKLKSAEDKRSDFIYSIANNSFLSKRGMYITFADNQMFVSLDKTNWVVFNFTLMPQSNNDKDEPKENFKSDYIISYKLNKAKNEIEIVYSISFTPSDDMQTIKLKDNKPTFSLEKDMVLVDKDVKNTTIDLKKNILYIPEDTIFKSNMSINGNIVETKTSNNHIEIKALRDIFIYVKNKMLSISFNRKKWNFSILSLKFSPSATIKSTSNKEIELDFFLDINYQE